MPSFSLPGIEAALYAQAKRRGSRPPLVGRNPGGPGAQADDDGAIDLRSEKPKGGGLGFPIAGFARGTGLGYRSAQPTSNPFAGIINQGFGAMQGLGDQIGAGFGLANTLSSANRQAAYGPEAAMNIAQINNDAENYRTQARLAAQLASMGILGKIMGGFTGAFGGFGGGGYGGMTGFRATDSPQQAGFSQDASGQVPYLPGPYGGSIRQPAGRMSPTRQAMFQQRYGAGY